MYTANMHRDYSPLCLAFTLPDARFAATFPQSTLSTEYEVNCDSRQCATCIKSYQRMLRAGRRR
jgi:hypothetical protein